MTEVGFCKFVSCFAIWTRDYYLVVFYFFVRESPHTIIRHVSVGYRSSRGCFFGWEYSSATFASEAELDKKHRPTRGRFVDIRNWKLARNSTH